MKRYVVVSTNNNPDYIFYAPYVEKAWNSLGWNLCVMITADVNRDDLMLSNPETKIHALPDVPGMRKESIAQAGRLYASMLFDDDILLMTSDIDLLPLSNYWEPVVDDITVYGHDLTDHTYYPMGYTAMISQKWRSIFGSMELDANEYKHLAFAPDWASWWNLDWQMLTDRLRGKMVTHIHRGRRSSGTYAYGRVDRGDGMQIPAGETLIDAHCENINVRHPDKINKFISLFESKYGKL